MSNPALEKLLNTSWLTLEQVVRLLIAFFVMALVARHLGPERFGAYSYLFSLAGLFAPLAAFGLEAILMRRSAAAPEESDETLGTAIAIRLCGGILGGALAVATVASFGGPAGATPVLMMFAAITLFFHPAETFNAWFKARERMAWVALPRIAVAVAIAGGALGLVYMGAGLAAFVALRAAEAGALAVAAVGAYGVATGRLRHLRPARALVGPLLREGWPLFLGGLAVVIYMRIDQVMLGWMAPERELGLYGVAVRVAEVSFFLPMALQASFYASLVRTHARAPEEFEDHMQRLYDVMALASFAAMLATGALAALLLVPVFGRDYAESLPMTLVVLLSVPAVFLGVARGVALTIRGWLWTSPFAAALGALVNIILNLLWIPIFGGLGAAAATVISYWIATIGASWLLPWLRPTATGMTLALNFFAAASRLSSIWGKSLD